MRIGYLSKVGAAVTAFFAPPHFHLSGGGHAPAKEITPSKSVAIIGAGAGGASTAYYLNNFLQQQPLTHKVEHSITIFDQADRIGGRCTVFKVRDPNQSKEQFVEIGASIFVKVNHNLVDAANEFGLKTKPLDSELMAIWDGKQFIFEESHWKYWSVLKGLWRWGTAPIKLQRLLKKTVSDLLMWYQSSEAFESIIDFAHSFHLHHVANIFSHTYMEENSIHTKYSQEIVEVATRVNYGSNLDEIHALGALVTMAAEDALQIQDGNFQIFEGMVGRSKADVRLNTKVARVRKLQPEHEGDEPQFEVTTTSGQREVFDSIVIAAPIHSSDIDFDLDLPPLPKISYRTVHATFVRGRVNPAYFNAPSDKKFPSHILTTNSVDVEFTSLSIQLKLSNGETVTKIFSPEPLQPELLDRLYSSRTWVKHKVWKAYPRLRPIGHHLNNADLKKDANITPEQNQQFVLDELKKQQEQSMAETAWAKVEVVPGVFYVNAFEPLVSTMETETIAGKNVARLVRDRMLGYCAVEEIKK
ncbi:hypothetical protein BGX28_008711 [Mortierella sp. GBA30]|nr:hypothetical protein BGX28_008711 [Mortierella sp. GBA30]